MLEAHDIEFSYRRDMPVLRGVSVALEPGSFIALLGVNGSGKSTLLGCLTGMRTPTAGQVLLDGVPLNDVPKSERARKVALVAQHSHANRLTVYDSVLLGRLPYVDEGVSEDDHAVVDEVLESLGLSDFALRYVDELSGGEYQKVVLARAFAQRTDTLLLDEPTNNLDLANTDEVMGFVRREVDERGVAALAVLHDVNLALRFCDRFLFLRDGRQDAFGDESVVTAERIKEVYGLEADVIEHRGRRVMIPR